MKYPLNNEFFLNRFNNDCTKYIHEGALVRLERIPPPRTGNQNRYYRALIGILSAYTGYTEEETHELCKRSLGLIYEKESKKGITHTFTKSTADLDSKEMSEYIEKVRQAGDRIGCYLPTAEEYEKNWQQIEGQTP